MKEKSLTIAVIYGTCVLLVGLTLIIGLWPFEENVINRVHWLEEDKGLHIGNRGIILSDGLSGEDFPFNETGIHALEIVFESHIQANLYIPRVLSFSDKKKEERFFIGLRGENLLLASPDGDGNLRDVQIGVDLYPYGKKRVLTLVQNNRNTMVYLEGKLLHTTIEPVIPESADSGFSYIVIGNSPRGDNPWVGNLYGLGIYSYVPGEEDLRINARSWLTRGYPAMEPGPSKGVLFLLDEGEGRTARNDQYKGALLRFPEKFRPLKWNFLRPPWTERRGRRQTLFDMALNFIGFIPMGFCLSALYYHRLRSFFRTLALAVFSGLVVSLTIELVQVVLPARFSSLSDLTLNSLGTAGGALLYLVPTVILRTVKWRDRGPAIEK